MRMKKYRTRIRIKIYLEENLKGTHRTEYDGKNGFKIVCLKQA